MRYRLCLEADCKDKIIAVAKDYDVVVVDSQDYTKEEIATIRKAGAKVLSYINVGAIEKERSYFSSIKNKGLLVCKYDNWDGEWWVDASATAWREQIALLAKEMLKKGVDGFWVDNLDVYYMADEEWKWSSSKKKTLYSQLKDILSDLHKLGYVMVNGGDVFVSKLMSEDPKYKGVGIIDAINQETVFSSITSYSGDGKFGKQSSNEHKYFIEYVELAAEHGIEVFLLEYTTDSALITEITKYCNEKGFSFCVSSTIKLGGDIKISMSNSGNKTSSTSLSNMSLDNLQLKIAACDVLLGEYGAGDERVKRLSVFGSDNAKKIQEEVNVMVASQSFTDFNMALYIIKGFAGKSKDREAKLGKYYSGAQKKVNEIYALSGKSVQQAAKYVIEGKFGTGEVRTTLLSFCGYDSKKVQSAVNDILAKKDKEPEVKPAPVKEDTTKDATSRIRVWGIWFFEGDESQYGDATAIIEYEPDDKTIKHVVLIDTAKATSKTVAKLKAAGVKTIDAVVISHAHGDHYGGLTNIFKNFTVKALYLPGIDGLNKYQKSYADAIKNQEKKAAKYGAKCSYMVENSSFTIGGIYCRCLYQVPANLLKEHDDHHFINNQSTVLRFKFNGVWSYYTAGDCQNEANKVIVKNVKDIRADIFKCQWHGDRNAITHDLAKAIKPLIGFSNYHHKERSGRKGTREVLEKDAGTVVARNHENGDIYIDCVGKTMTLSCSKGNLKKKFTIL